MGSHRDHWRRTASRYLFESRWFNLRQDQVQLPGGESITYTLVEHPGFAMIVPLLADGRVILERVFRYTNQDVVLECPSGGLDGEPPEVAARRELEEETGWTAGRMESLGTFYSANGNSDAKAHLFLATDLSEDGTVAREVTEEIELVMMPLDDAIRAVFDGRLLDEPSALALLIAERKLREPGRGRAQESRDGPRS